MDLSIKKPEETFHRANKVYEIHFNKSQLRELLKH
jgi:hypothetical protein